MKRETVDLQEVRRICESVFANRKAQAWPPKLEISDEWRIAYDRTKGGLGVIESCDDAALWLNGLIRRIAMA